MKLDTGDFSIEDGDLYVEGVMRKFGAGSLDVGNCSLKQVDSETYPLLIEDDTGVETGEISRSLTYFIFNTGTTANYDLQVGGTSYIQTASNLINFLRSIKQIDSESYPLLIEDDTGVETGEISRSLTYFIFNTGTTADFDFKVSGTSYAQTATNLFNFLRSIKQVDSETYPLLLENDAASETAELWCDANGLVLNSATGTNITFKLADTGYYEMDVDALFPISGTPELGKSGNRWDDIHTEDITQYNNHQLTDSGELSRTSSTSTASIDSFTTTDGTAGTLEAFITGYSATSTIVYTGIIAMGYKTVSNIVALIGAQTNIHVDDSSGASTWIPTFSVTGGSTVVSVDVTPDDANNTDWICNFRWQEVPLPT